MKAKLAIVSALLLTSIVAPAQVYTNPVGYVSITCPANSDTIVGLPLRQSAAATVSLSANPDTTTIVGSAILSLSGTPGFTTDQFATAYYVKFKSGTDIGKWFQITGNSASSITVDLNGGSVSGVLSGDSLEVLKFWTLNELFPSNQCTTNPATTGNAVVATADPDELMTQILIPNLVGAGINLAPAETYYVFAGSGWKKFGQVADAGATLMWPDTYFIIRNPIGVATTYTISGEVEMSSMAIPLSTRTGGQQDNFIGIPRGVDRTLNQLNLGGTSAFVTTTDPDDIQDQLLVFNNQAAAQNKSPSATYYYYGGAWRKFGQATDAGADVISAGSGILIRKAATVDGATKLWTNNANY